MQSDDILNLDLSAELVVLSSCQSDLGKQVRGEGLTALSQSFFYRRKQGASIISLWNVDDKITAEFMIRFYRKHLVENESAAALRQMQLEIMRYKRRASLFYWSAFVLQGK